MEPREIPGMFYDRGKRKYFKIQGSTAPSNSAYSKESIKKLKIRDDHETKRAVQATRTSKLIQRPLSTNPSLSGSLLQRQYGYSLSPDLERRTFTSNLTEHPFAFAIWHLKASVEPCFHIRPLESVDGQSVSTVTTARDNRVQTIPDAVNGSFSTNVVNHVFDAGPAPVTTSLSVHEGSGWNAVTYLTNSTDKGIGIWKGVSEYGNETPATTHGPGTLHGAEVDVLCSTPSPPTSPSLFAFGTSKGILTLSAQTHNLSWLKSLLTYDTIHALTYLTPTTLATGSKSGSIQLLDLRSSLAASTHIIQHPSLITHIEQIDDNSLLVNGLQSSLLKYDIRYSKPQTPIYSSRPSITLAPTRPTLTFPHHRNEHSLRTGLSLSRTLSLLAAAQEIPPYIKLFSLATGEVMPSPKLHIPETPEDVRKDPSRRNRMKPRVRGRPPKCLQWVTRQGGGGEEGGEELYVSEGSGEITKYAWDRGGGEEAEEGDGD